jgi:hypothetical protein
MRSGLSTSRTLSEIVCAGAAICRMTGGSKPTPVRTSYEAGVPAFGDHAMAGKDYSTTFAAFTWARSDNDSIQPP